MFENLDIYTPCFCGSGKKFKFCCMPRLKAVNKDLIKEISLKEDALAEKEFDIGNSFLEKHDFEKAIPHFTKSMELNPNNPSACNDYVLCMMFSGHFEECMPILQKHLAECPVPNPFGMALLSELYFLSGEEDLAKSTILIAASMPYQTQYSVGKVCEGMAYLKMHRQIVEFYKQKVTMDIDCEEAFFYMGIAMANLGSTDEAIGYLSDVSIGSDYSDIAAKTLGSLKAGKPSENIFGEWNYFYSGNFVSSRFVNATPENLEKYKKCSWLVDLTRMLLEENPKDEACLDFMLFSEHPEGIKLLKAVLDWPKASQSLRMKAISILRKKEEMTVEEAGEALNKGASKKSYMYAEIEIDPEYQYCPALPEEDDEVYCDLVSMSHEEDCDLEALAMGYRNLREKYPDYLPVRNNLAAALIAMGQHEEGEAILREIMTNHPPYLFAQAGLIHLYCSQDRFDEAEQIIKTTQMPPKANNGTMAAYWNACVEYYAMDRKMDIAKNYLDMIAQVAPGGNEYEVAEITFNAAKKLNALLRKFSKGGRRKKK